MLSESEQRLWGDIVRELAPQLHAALRGQRRRFVLHRVFYPVGFIAIAFTYMLASLSGAFIGLIGGLVVGGLGLWLRP